MKTRIIIAVAVCLAAGASLIGHHGTLDPAFNGSGIVTTDFAIAGIGNYHWATSVALDSQGRIVQAGYTTAGSSLTLYEAAIARHNPDGTPDTTFNGTGKVIHDFGGDDRVMAVAIWPDDSIIVAGHSDWNPGCEDVVDCGSNYNFFVAKFFADGSLDTSFGDNGRRIIGFESDAEYVSGMTIDSQLRIVVVGTSFQSHIIDPDINQTTLVRLTAGGDLDVTFDGDGKYTTNLDLEFFENTGNAVVADNAGRVIVGSHVSSGFSMITRLNGDGSRDNSFGGDGRVSVADIGSDPCSTVVKALAIDASGRILAAGSCTYPTNTVVVARFDPNGYVDTSFGQVGYVRLNISSGGGLQEARGIVADSLGRVIVAGVATQCGHDMFVARLTEAGEPDVHFGSGGSGWTVVGLDNAPPCSLDEANGVVLDPQRGIVIGGGTTNETNTNTLFIAARVRLEQPDYSLSPIAPFSAVPGGDPGVATLTINSIDGFAENVKVAVYGSANMAPLHNGLYYTFDGFGSSQEIMIAPPPYGSASYTLRLGGYIWATPATYTLWVVDHNAPDHAISFSFTLGATLTSTQEMAVQFGEDGLIDSPGVVMSITTSLKNAEASVSRGQIDAAINELTALENYIAVQSDKHIATTATVGGQTFNPAKALSDSVAAIIEELSQ